MLDIGGKAKLRKSEQRENSDAGGKEREKEQKPGQFSLTFFASREKANFFRRSADIYDAEYTSILIFLRLYFGYPPRLKKNSPRSSAELFGWPAHDRAPEKYLFIAVKRFLRLRGDNGLRCNYFARH